MLYKLAPVKNVVAFDNAFAALISRPAGTPGLGLVYGFTGAGKTTAVHRRIVSSGAVYIRAMSLWSPTRMCQTICRELGIQPSGQPAEMVDRIITRMTDTGKALFIDEADYLLWKKPLIECIRDFHDVSNVPIVLIGMTGIEIKVQKYAQLERRFAQKIKFNPLDCEDIRILAKTCCEAPLADDLVEYLQLQLKGSMGLVMVNLPAIERVAQGLDQPCTLNDWLSTGKTLHLGA
jgi:DNA transposition AAA+ family ATPase